MHSSDGATDMSSNYATDSFGRSGRIPFVPSSVLDQGGVVGPVLRRLPHGSLQAQQRVRPGDSREGLWLGGHPAELQHQQVRGAVRHRLAERFHPAQLVLGTGAEPLGSTYTERCLTEEVFDRMKMHGAFSCPKMYNFKHVKLSCGFLSYFYTYQNIAFFLILFHHSPF